MHIKAVSLHNVRSPLRLLLLSNTRWQLDKRWDSKFTLRKISALASFRSILYLKHTYETIMNSILWVMINKVFCKYFDCLYLTPLMIINIYSLTSLPKFQLRIKREGSVASSRFAWPEIVSQTPQLHSSSKCKVTNRRFSLSVDTINIFCKYFNSSTNKTGEERKKYFDSFGYFLISLSSLYIRCRHTIF